MRKHSIQGVWRGKGKRTTVCEPELQRADDLVNRQFTASRPNQLWVADFTYVATHQGFVYTAFIIDVFARRIVGWKVAKHMDTGIWLWMHWNRLCTLARSPNTSFTTASGAANTYRFAIPNVYRPLT